MPTTAEIVSDWENLAPTPADKPQVTLVAEFHVEVAHSVPPSRTVGLVYS